MKIAILGAAGVRTPLIIEAIAKRQDKIGLSELALMDIDGERLDLIGTLTAHLDGSSTARYRISYTTDARLALLSADYVITTFRVGGIESRVIDERVPLTHGVLGQETTGPGGFAMGLRSIPVLLDYVRVMQEVCPDAWLINFANPAGMLTEAVVRSTNWKRVVGICDAPSSMWSIGSAILGVPPEETYLDYFGLNHLGWARSFICKGDDRLPGLIKMVLAAGKLPWFPFDAEFINSLGMVPNEYLYYYYNTEEAIKNITSAGQTRSGQIAVMNHQLFNDLKRLQSQDNWSGMLETYYRYMNQRGETYMTRETGISSNIRLLNGQINKAISGDGYAGVALNLIESLYGKSPRVMILNVTNLGAITGMEDKDVVEIPAYVGRDLIRPITVGKIPDHCLGLVKQVKAYEHLTIESALEKSYSKAITALAIHPLVPNYTTAKTILDEYIIKHQPYFPILN